MKNLIQSLAKARLNFGSINKNGEGVVGNGKYNYATLDDIIAATAPALAREGLVTYHTYQIREHTLFGFVEATTAHVTDGETELTSTVELPLSSVQGHRNPVQAVGSILSYGRRYSLSALLSINTEADDDAQNSVDKEPLQQIAKPKSPIAAVPTPPPAPVPPPADKQQQQIERLNAKFDEYDIAPEDRERILAERQGKTISQLVLEMQACKAKGDERQQALDKINKKIAEEYATEDQKLYLEGKLRMSLESIKNIATLDGLLAVLEVINDRSTYETKQSSA